MEQTQLLDWDGEGEPGDYSEGAGETPKPVGRLHLLSSKYGPEKDFWIYPGENVIGRLESCQIYLPASSVSKAHAVIEVPSSDGPHLLYDKDSLNRTRRQRMVLIPHVRYSLQDGDSLLFGDVGCQYFVLAPGTATESPNDSLEVPPSQMTVNASALAIEETPAPGRRMGFGGVLAHDSDKEEEEEVHGAGRMRHLPESDGSDSSFKDGARGHSRLASPMFSSPSATVVPESDDESGEPPGGGPSCPSMRLRYENDAAAPGSLVNGAVTSPTQEGDTVQPASTAPPDTGEPVVPSDPSLIDFHLDSDTDVEDEERMASASEGPAPGDLAKGGLALEVGSDTDTEEPVAMDPAVGLKPSHQAVLDVSSDTDAEEAGERRSVPGHKTHQLAENGGDDTDVEGAAGDPSAASPESHGPSPPNANSRRGTAGNPSQPSDEKLDSDTEAAEEAADEADVCSRPQQPAGSEDSDTDVDEASIKVKENLGTLRGHEAARDSDADTDVEVVDLQLEDSGCPVPHPISSMNNSAGGEETPNRRVALQEGPTLIDGVRRNSAVREGNSPTVEAQMGCKATTVHHRGSDEKEDIEAEEHPSAVPQRQDLPALTVDSDTDVEEAAVPHVNLQKSHRIAGDGPTGGKMKSFENPEVAPQEILGMSPDGDSDTDVEATSPSHKAPAAQDSDTDVEDISTLLPGKPLEEQDTQLVPVRSWEDREKLATHATEQRVCHGPWREDKVTDAEGNESYLGDESSTDTEGDPDLAFQPTQCYLSPGTSSPKAEKTGGNTTEVSSCALGEEATQEFVFRFPPTPIKLLPGKDISPSKDSDSELDAYALEATQPYCKEHEDLSEEPTQAYIAKEEEETELLLLQHPPEAEDLSEQATQPVLPVSASTEPQTLTSLPEDNTQPYSLQLPSCPVPVDLPRGGKATEDLQEEKEIRSVDIPRICGNQSLALPATEGVSRSPEQKCVIVREWGSAAEPSQRRADEELGCPNARIVPLLKTEQMPTSADAESKGRTSAPAADTKDAEQLLPESVKKEVPQPVASVPEWRRSLRSSAAASPIPVSEGRSCRRGHTRSVDTDGSTERVAPVRRQKGLRQLSDPSLCMEALERKARQPGREEASTNPKPRIGEPTVAASEGQLRRSQRIAGATATANRPKEETAKAAVSLGTREPTRRGKRRLASEPEEEQQLELPRTRASRRCGGTPVTTPSPKDAGKDGKRGQEPTPPTSSSGRRSQHQCTENKSVGMRAQSRNRSQDSVTSGITAPKVLFTGVIDEEGERVVKELGGSLAESIFSCTHLVTDRVRRTVKFLCALARGIPIVTLDWLEKSRQSSSFLAPVNFLICDPEQEKNFQFCLAESLRRARQEGGLLQGYEIHVTPNVKPEPEHMRDIIKCSGGTFLPRMPRAYKDKRIVISCSEDLSRCKPAMDARVPIANSEFILTGILQQAVDLDSHRLGEVGISSPAMAAAASPSVTRASKRRATVPMAPTPPSTAKRRR